MDSPFLELYLHVLCTISTITSPISVQISKVKELAQNFDDLLNDNSLVVEVTLLPTTKTHNKSLHKNHPCTFYNTYGHYSHHCHDFQSYRIHLRSFTK